MRYERKPASFPAALFTDSGNFSPPARLQTWPTDSLVLDTAERAHRAAADPSNFGTPVRITGVVTYCDPEWHLLFLQDQSGGFFVELNEGPDLKVGQLVEVTGALAPSNRGIDDPRWRIQGSAPMPVAQPLPDAGESSPQRLSRWVVLRGTVRAASPEDGRLSLIVLDHNRRAKVRVLTPPQVRPINFVGTEVQVAGVAASAKDKKGNLAGIQVFISSLAQIKFLGSSKLEDPFSIQPEPDSAALNRRTVGELVRVAGSVVEQKPGQVLVMRVGQSNVAVHLSDYSQLAPGDSVDALGFVSTSSAYKIEDTIVRIVAPRTPVDDTLIRVKGALRTIRDLKNLSVEAATKELPVDVQGTVTYFDPFSSLLFVQDSTAGVYVDIHNASLAVEVGDTVRVAGFSGSGDYAPIIIRPTITVLGRGSMPKPLTLPLQGLVSGSNDAGWVEIVGIVHSTSQLSKRHSFKLDVAGINYDVQLPRAENIDTLQGSLLDAQVKIAAVSGTVYNEKRQLVGLKFFVPAATYVQIVEPAPTKTPGSVRPIASLLRFDSQNLSMHRTTIHGSVTLQEGQQALYVQDASAGIYVVPEQTTQVGIGQLVEVSGFPVASPTGPFLEDAVVRVIDGASRVVPVKLTSDDLTTGMYQSQLVTVVGRLLERVASRDEDILILQSGTLVLRARLPEGAILPGVIRDSVLEITGILQTVGLAGQNNFQIALPSADNIRIIQAAPWWTWENVARALTVTIIGILAAIAFVSVRAYRVRSYQARHDSLTGLLNRGSTLEYLKNQMARAERERCPVGVVLADLDHFKRINDTHGHQAGDAVLRKMAEILKLDLRPNDAAGRYGGEEFLLVLPNCDAATANSIAERIRERLCEERFSSTLHAETFNATSSFGVAIANAELSNLEAVLASADRALYAAKNDGRNRVASAIITSAEAAPQTLLAM